MRCSSHRTRALRPIQLVDGITREHREVECVAWFPFLLIAPEAAVLDAWNLVVLLLVLVQAVTLPVEAAFDLSILGRSGDHAILAVFVADMLLNFCLAFTDPVSGELVRSSARIAVRRGNDAHGSHITPHHGLARSLGASPH